MPWLLDERSGRATFRRGRRPGAARGRCVAEGVRGSHLSGPKTPENEGAPAGYRGSLCVRLSAASSIRALKDDGAARCDADVRRADRRAAAERALIPDEEDGLARLMSGGHLCLAVAEHSSVIEHRLRAGTFSRSTSRPVKAPGRKPSAWRVTVAAPCAAPMNAAAVRAATAVMPSTRTSLILRSEDRLLAYLLLLSREPQTRPGSVGCIAPYRGASRSSTRRRSSSAGRPGVSRAGCSG